MYAPHIGSAIPKRRYQYGEFTVTLLRQIETNDPIQYQFVLAFVQEGQTTPVLFVTSEKNRRSEAVQGSHRMRLITENSDTVLDSSDEWRDEEAFTTAGLKIASNILGLTDVAPFRLM